MAQKQLVDLDLDNVARVINSLDPVNAQDVVTKAFVFNQDAEELPETSTTSTTVDSTKATLTLTGLVSGNYILEWSFKWRALAANRAIRVNIKDNGTELINFVEFSPNIAKVGCITGRKKLTGITGNKIYTLNFRVQGTSTTVYMSEALLSIRRVA